jgi:hypothetical protein
MEDVGMLPETIIVIGGRAPVAGGGEALCRAADGRSRTDAAPQGFEATIQAFLCFGARRGAAGRWAYLADEIKRCLSK